MILICFYIACAAYTYAVILTEPNGMLNSFYLRAYNFFKCEERQAAGKNYHWLFMLSIGCYKCIAGQMAFWYYLFTCEHYRLDFHLFFTSVTVVLVRGIYKLINNE